jgi:hypothetical protein
LPCRSPPGQYSPRLPRNVMRDRGTRWCWASLLASSPSRQPGCIRSGSSVRRGGVRAPPGRVRIAGARAGQCGGADLLHPPPGPLHPDPMPSWARSSGRLGGSSTTWIPTGPATWNRSSAVPTHRPGPHFCRPAAPATFKLSSPSPHPGGRASGSGRLAGPTGWRPRRCGHAASLRLAPGPRPAGRLTPRRSRRRWPPRWPAASSGPWSRTCPSGSGMADEW